MNRNSLSTRQGTHAARIPGVGQFTQQELFALLPTDEVTALYALLRQGQTALAQQRVRELAVAYRGR